MTTNQTTVENNSVTLKPAQYLLALKNDYCAADHITSGSIGGLELDLNLYNFPLSVLTDMRLWATESEEGKVWVYINVTLQFSLEEVLSSKKLSEIFAESYYVTKNHRYLSQESMLPAIRSQKLFVPLLNKMQDKWGEINTSYSKSWSDKDRNYVNTSAAFTAVLNLKGEDAFSVFTMCLGG